MEGKFQSIGSWGNKIKDYYKYLGVDPNQTLGSLSDEQFFALKYGSAKTKFKGVNCFIPLSDHITANAANNAANITERQKIFVNNQIYSYDISCPKCNGTGLGEQAANTTIGGKTITELENLYISDLRDFFRAGKFPGARLVETILTKLECMTDVGLHHLALSRPVPTLSGGEIQRLFLASYIIAEMDSIIFIFDEPTIGLHELEKQKLIDIIQNLIKRGNTVIAVEHDENFMRAADYIVDLGPHAGDYGGERIFQGTYTEFMNCQNSLTSPYLSGRTAFPVKTDYKRIDSSKLLTLENCRIHNLRDVSVDIPLGLMIGVAGVSGSGKSSLVADTLVPKLKETLKNKLVFDDDENESALIMPDVVIRGTEHIKKCIIVDQRPIGRSRTSCPATYTGVWDKVRALFAKESGMDVGLFSLNSAGGCRVCKGDGVIHHHVGWGNFIHTDCEACGGTGFIEDAMWVILDGKNIRDVLEMSVSAAVDFFREKDRSALKMLQTLERVGMGYIKLGQKTPTISGGEAQRIKLAAELGKSGSIKGNLYILDEPTTGLSFSDSERLLLLMQELVDKGATVIVTEHDPNMLSSCDYIIEMGPGGGNNGGYVISTGTPKELKENMKSVIGRYLK
jgi:excinuclease ABC A subunit